MPTKSTSQSASRSCRFSQRMGLLALLIVFTCSVRAQDALQDLVALDTSRQVRREQVASPKYTFKSGDLRVLAVPSLGLDFNDNINTSSTDKESDFILKPFINFDLTYPLTQVNLLTVNLGLGYDYYFDHHDESGIRIASGSAISFDIYVKDFVINLHDRLSYSQDPSQESSIANTSEFGTFENTVGVLTAWNLKKGTISFGYDHQNVISTQSSFDQQNHASEILLARGSYLVHPQVQAGLEGTVSFTAYDQPQLNDNTAYSMGPFVSWQPGKALNLMFRGGYVFYDFKQTSTLIEARNLSTYYVDLTVTHDATKLFSYTFSAGREVNLGVQSDITEQWYIRPNVNWHLFRHISFNTGVSYENGNQGDQGLSGASIEEHFNWLGATVGVTWPFMKRLSLGANYRYTFRESDLPNRGYNQNVVGLTLTYTPP